MRRSHFKQFVSFGYAKTDLDIYIRIMKKKYQNGFFIFGLVVLAVMITQLDFEEVYSGLCRAGYWFFAVVALWALLYVLNTATWYIIIRSGAENKPRIKFAWLYKITVSGFALNYATPGGLMGGEPYRIMSLSPAVGTERASASVILYAMTHIFSHFIFWLLSVILFIVTEPVNMFTGVLFSAVAAFCIAGIWFFLKGYRKGMAVRIMNIIRHVPGLKKRAKGFICRHEEQLSKIDGQIAALHGQNRRTFVAAVSLELLCRILSAFEIMFILLVVMPDVSFVRCILILAFTGFFANLLFFLPLQLGGREGGFLMSTAGLSMSAGAGIFVALIVRIRELIWTAAGLLMIKFEKKNNGRQNG